MSFGLSAMNAAYGHHARSNRAESEAPKGSMREYRWWHGIDFLGRKVGEVGIAAWLGYMEGHDGEPMWGSDDPTKAIGLKLIGTAVLNAVEFARLMIGPKAFFGHHLGLGGTFVDGTIQGGTSAFTVALVYDNSNTFGAAKRQQENAAKAKGGVDYNKAKPRALASKPETPSPMRAEVEALEDPAIANAVAQATRYNADIYADFR